MGSWCRKKNFCTAITEDAYAVKLEINVSILWHDEFSEDGHDSNEGQ
jgi:hypothetical protein